MHPTGVDQEEVAVAGSLPLGVEPVRIRANVVGRLWLHVQGQIELVGETGIARAEVAVGDNIPRWVADSACIVTRSTNGDVLRARSVAPTVVGVARRTK